MTTREVLRNKTGTSVNYDTSVLSKADSVWTKADDERLLAAVERHRSPDSFAQWKQVSATMNVPAQQCLARYENVLIHQSTSPWTDEEVSVLLLLVEQHGPYDWPALAQMLGTGRSGIECLRKFQRDCNVEHVSHGTWSVAEEALLKQGIDEFGTSDWQAVSSVVGSRSASQCLQRSRKAADLQPDVISGRWTDDEERMLLLACIAFHVPTLASSKFSSEVISTFLHGGALPDHDAATDDSTTPSYWVRIASCLVGKTPTQCREKWTNNLDPTIDSSEFRPDELQTLAILVERLGESRWTLVARFLPGRTDWAVRRNWLQLKKQSS